MYSTSPGTLHVHMFASNEAKVTIDGHEVSIVQETMYPWDGHVQLRVTPVSGMPPLVVKVRQPGWCHDAAVSVNGVPVNASVESGYLFIDGVRGETIIDLTLGMPVELVHAHPAVEACLGRVALCKGPVVYCLEEIDNGRDVDAITLLAGDRFDATFEKDLLGGVVVLRGEAIKQASTGWDGTLYQPVTSKASRITITAVPYFAWGNRQPKGAMITWVREAPVQPRVPARLVS